MKKYKILVIYPGMSSLVYEVIANEFKIVVDGAYIFYDKDGSVLNAFPIGLTIIEEILNIK